MRAQAVLFRVLLIAGAAVFLWLNLRFGGAGPAASGDGLESASRAGAFSLRTYLPGVDIFTNHVDGYSLKTPSGLTVDMSESGVRAVLEGEGLRLEIYRQPCGAAYGFTQDEYISYSNSALTAGAGFTLSYSGRLPFLDKDARLLIWHREALARIENDRPFYASLDMILPGQNAVYTVLVKSALPLAEGGQPSPLFDLISDFQAAEISAAPYEAPRGRQGAPPGLDAETRDFYLEHFLGGDGLLWGIFQPEAPLDFDALHALEERLGYKFPLLLYYTGVIEGARAHPRVGRALKNAFADGRIVELTLQIYPARESVSVVFDILNGEYDAFLRDYAGVAAEAGGPILFRFGNEMNGDWCAYSALNTGRDTELFKVLYRYIHGIFREAGAANLLWVWNPNAGSFPDFKWNDALCYYPGDEFVDIVGLTAYNTGTYYPGEDWESFDALYTALYARYAALFRQPLMITEFASSSVGGDKAEWVRRMFARIGDFDRIRAAVWWNSRDLDANGDVARPYFLDETVELTEIFRENLR